MKIIGVKEKRQALIEAARARMGRILQEPVAKAKTSFLFVSKCSV